MTQKRFYVYELVIEPDHKICYVGKGSGRRMFVHEKRAKAAVTRHHKVFYAELRNLFKAGKHIVPRIIFETDDEIEALLYEAGRIREIGFENLLNQASHAFLGRSLKSSTKAVISAISKRLWDDPVFRERITAAQSRGRIGLKHSEETKLKLRRPRNFRGKFGKGVSKWSAPGKSTRWMARITISGKFVTLGYFRSPLEAARAYDNVCEKHYENRPNGTTK